MNLSPNDIINYEFSSQMRGYDKEEVDSFLEQIASAMEEIKQANLKLSLELDAVRNQLNSLRQFEDTIKSAAIDARRNADMTVGNAKKEAEDILNNAKNEAAKVLEKKSQKVQDIENQISQLDLTRRSYLAKLKGLISSHLEIVDEIDKSEIPQSKIDQIERDILEVTDSSEVESGKRAIAPEKTQTDEPEEQSVPDPLMQDEDEQSVEEEIDPELQAALKSFSHEDEEDPYGEEPSPIKGYDEKYDADEKVDPQTGWIETDRRAEDVPPEFIVGNQNSEDVNNTTDRVYVDDNSFEAVQDKSVLKEVNPLADNLAEELDKVVEKFEEEMNKAEK